MARPKQDCGCAPIAARRIEEFQRYSQIRLHTPLVPVTGATKAVCIGAVVTAARSIRERPLYLLSESDSGPIGVAPALAALKRRRRGCK